MELGALIERVPALERAQAGWRSLMARQAVWLAPASDQLELMWWQQDAWCHRAANLPADICRDGLPLQREALAEFIADLLLESGLPPTVVDLHLMLPLEAGQWRLLEPPAAGRLGSSDDLRALQPELGWPFPLAEAYLALESPETAGGEQVLVGTERMLLQAWVAVIEAADLRLQQVDWLLAAARRQLVVRLGEAGGDLVWLLQQGRGWRLLLLRHGLPELDRYLPAGAELEHQVQQLLAAWQHQGGASTQPARWWITAPQEARQQQLAWCPWAEGEGQPSLLALALPDQAPITAAASSIDLLQERRQELGLAGAEAGELPTRPLLLRGSLVGGGVLLLTLLLLGVMGWREAEQARALAALLPVEARVTAAESRLRRMRARTAALRKDNTRLAEQLVAVRSGSALLEQLRRVTPGGVQLQSVRVQGDAIQISGEVAAAMAPGPLERINALVLALAALPMSAADGVEVVKITRPDADKERPAALTFSLRWTLDPAARPSLAELEALGADGLAARYRLLQQAGVAL